MAAYPEYFYIAVLGIIFGFINAMAMGTNDEVFASSVASGAVTFGQAIIIRGIFEFLGAVLLGSRVTSTIRGGIVNPEYYEENPTVFMFGNLCSLMVSTFMLIEATHFQLPVSTTHTIVACLIGFSLATMGGASIIWNKVGFVFLAWVVSPLFAGILSFVFFKIVKTTILQSEHVFHRACQAYPVVVFAGITLNLFFILLNINKNFKMEDYGLKVVYPGSVGGGLLCALVTHFFFVPWIKRRLGEDDNSVTGDDEEESVEYAVDGWEEKNTDSAIVKRPSAKKVEDDSDHLKDAAAAEIGDAEEAAEAPKQRSSNPIVAAWDWLADNTYRVDIKGKSFAEHKLAAQLWSRMEVKDIKTEKLFAYLQVFSAILASFAHCSNDVLHSIGPLSSILDIYQNGEFNTKAQKEIWMLALGGFGIALGFGLYGYKIIQALGFKLVALSPSRGFSMETAAAFTVSIATYTKMPVSSTQCLVRGHHRRRNRRQSKMGVQWWFFARVIAGWVGIFFVAMGINAAFFSFSAFSPKARA